MDLVKPKFLCPVNGHINFAAEEKAALYSYFWIKGYVFASIDPSSLGLIIVLFSLSSNIKQIDFLLAFSIGIKGPKAKTAEHKDKVLKVLG